MPGRFTNLEFEEERRHEFEAGETLRPREQVAREFLAQADHEYRWGRFEAALRHYTRALREDRTCIAAWVGQVQMLVQLDECHEARVWSDKALELFRGNGELLAAKAQAGARLNDFKTALACSDSSLQAAGSSPWRWIVRGETLLAKGEPRYEECFQKALAEPAADWFERVIIARVYVFHERLTNALCFLKESLELQPTHGYIWFEMGRCQKALSLESAARVSFQRCLDLRPDYREAQRELVELTTSRPFVERIRGLWRRWRGR